MGLETDAVVQTLLRDRVRITALAASVVRDAHAADDVFQQVVLGALQGKVAFREPGHVLAWALRAARHRAVDLARRRHLTPLPDDVLDLLEARWGDPDEAASSDQLDALRRCLGKLGEPARELLLMRYRDGLTAATIAGRLARTAEAVYQSLSRTHKALRGCVERDVAARSANGEVRA